MKYITLFEQQTAFDNAKSTLDRPNVSYVKENSNVYLLKKRMPMATRMLILVSQVVHCGQQ